VVRAAGGLVLAAAAQRSSGMVPALGGCGARIFVVFFLWYLFRYQVIKEYIGFFDLIRVILAGWAAILLTGLWDVVKYFRAKPHKGSKSRGKLRLS